MPVKVRKENIGLNRNRWVGSSARSDFYVFVKPNSLFTDEQITSYLPTQIKIALKYFYR